MNTYGYVGGNPLIYSDPEGLRFFSNAWNSFQARSAGNGMSRTQVRNQYRQHQQRQREAWSRPKDGALHETLGTAPDLLDPEVRCIIEGNCTGGWVLEEVCTCPSYNDGQCYGGPVLRKPNDSSNSDCVCWLEERYRP